MPIAGRRAGTPAERSRFAARIHQGRDRLRRRRIGRRLRGRRPRRRGVRAGRRHGDAARDAERQRPRPAGRRAAERDADPHAALQARPHRHQARLRSCRVRQLHGDARRCGELFLLDADPQRARSQDRHHRRHRRTERRAAPGAEGHGRRSSVRNAVSARPGQVVSAVALLKHNPKPTVEEARLGMSGNLCRCGAYDHYLKAVMRAAREA